MKLKGVSVIYGAFFFPAIFLSNVSRGNEGLHILFGKSCRQIVSNIGKFYSLPKPQKKMLDENLKRWALSTFFIEKGTAFFIGRGGEFTTAEHVISNLSSNEPNEIVTVQLRRGKLEPLPVWVNPVFDRQLGLDLALGKIPAFQPSEVIELATQDAQEVQLNDPVLILGYPGGTYRDGIFSPEQRERLEMRLRRQESSSPFGALAQRNRRERRAAAPYDKIPLGGTHLSASFGEVQLIAETEIYTSADVVGGFSGGPVINLRTGRAIGVASATITAGVNDDIDWYYYSGLTVVAPIIRDNDGKVHYQIPQAE